MAGRRITGTELEKLNDKKAAIITKANKQSRIDRMKKKIEGILANTSDAKAQYIVGIYVEAPHFRVYTADSQFHYMTPTAIRQILKAPAGVEVAFRDMGEYIVGRVKDVKLPYLVCVKDRLMNNEEVARVYVKFMNRKVRK